MSSAMNGKKNNSSGSSAVNTPASTPVTSVASVSNGQSATQTSPPLNNNAPKYGEFRHFEYDFFFFALI